MSLPCFHRHGTLNVNLLVHILIVRPSWGLSKALLFALMFVLYPVAQISIYKPMLGFKKLLKLGFFTDSCCKPSGKSFCIVGIYKAKPGFCADIFHCL